MKRRTHLTDWFFFWFILIQVCGVLSLSASNLLIPYLVAFGVFVALTLVDHLSLIGTNQNEASLDLPPSPELGEEVSIKLLVDTKENRILQLSKFYARFEEVDTLLFERTQSTLKPSSHSMSVYEAHFKATAHKLGKETIPQVTITGHSRFGLWFRTKKIVLSHNPFRVVPSHREISEQAFRELTSTQRLLYQGSRRTLRGRTADQFYSIRDYQFPDEFRHIDYKKTAKYQKLMTRVYDSFYDHHLIIGLDLGRSLRGSLGPSEKADFYLAACLMLAENAHKSRDRISFFAFSQKVHFMIRNTRHIADFTPLYEGSGKLATHDEESNFDLLVPTLSYLSGQRSIVILFTDTSRPSVQESLKSNLSSVCARHLTTVISLLDEDYSLEHQVLNYQGEGLSFEQYGKFMYMYWLDESYRRFQRQVASQGGGTLMASEKDWMSVVSRVYSLMRESTRL